MKTAAPTSEPWETDSLRSRPGSGFFAAAAR